MSDKDSATSRSSLPILRDEDDENDEIVFFGDYSDQTGNGGGYNFDHYEDDLDGDLPRGYSRNELEQEVTFIRSSKNTTTGDFLREKKDLLWCLENGCEEVTPGVWSGAWYFSYLYGGRDGERAWVEAQNRRQVKESDGKAKKVGHDDFCEMLKLKMKGNRAFTRGQYKTAVDNYVAAEKLLGGAIVGLYLVPHQREELVKILSNQAECYLRMQKYDDAKLQASAALQLDKHHEKSLLRRAKATFFGAERKKALNSMVAARAAEDLQVIIEMKREGVAEARLLMDEIDGKVNANVGPSHHQ